MKYLLKDLAGLVILFGFLLFSYHNINAHCDGIDGPVVKAANKALETGNVNLVLIWVRKDDESTIKDAFQKTLHVRKLDQQAHDLADSYFFETLVRIHRTGEGESYTGLKPAGRDLGPVIPEADKSIEAKSMDRLKTVFAAKKLGTGKIEELFNNVIRLRDYDINDIEAGRKYVHSYVTFIHTAEHLFDGNKQIQDQNSKTHENSHETH